MALGLRYKGEFLSIAGVLWRVEILQEGYGGTQPGELRFPMDPLEIEWAESAKTGNLQTSNATLQVISETDRQFVDLYSVEVGAVRLDVYRNNVLYWSGTMDTELYSEPYYTGQNYDVTLTFSDFSCLGRLDWDGATSGFITIHDLIMRCISRAGVNTSAELHKLISTCEYASQYGSSTPLTFKEVKVLLENFVDEDGEVMTYRDMLEAVLCPFALRLVQKAGKVHLYDLNALYSQNPKRVQWDDTDSQLDVDKIYNNVKVTFSPYGAAEMMAGKVEEDKSKTAESGGTLVYRDYAKNQYGALTSLEGFRFHRMDEAKSNMEVANGAKFFQICSIYSGNDDTGVVETFKQGNYPVSVSGEPSHLCSHVVLEPRDCGTKQNGNAYSKTIIKCPRVHLGYSSYKKSDFYLRVSLDMLFDVRYNPFEDASDNNDNASYSSGFLGWGTSDGPFQNMKDWCNLGYVPIKLTLQDEQGNALCHFDNRLVEESDGYDHGIKCKWVDGPAEWGDAFLCYYDNDDRKSNTGFGGWQTNKQIIGYYRDGLPKQWDSLDDGEYIPLPPKSGYLVLEIGMGVHQFDYKRETKNIYKYVRWILFKEPTITLCHKNYKEAETEDIEDSAWIDRNAKEELSIETIVGTCTQKYGAPNAKGQIFKADGSVYYEFGRAGVNDRLERLLIGTVYSQSAGRHDVLSGTVVLLPDFGIYSDAATAGKFLLVSEYQRCREDVSEIKMVDFVEDNYQGIEYE